MSGIGKSIRYCLSRPFSVAPRRVRYGWLGGGAGHDLAPVCRDIGPARGYRRMSSILSKRLFWPVFCGRSRGERMSDGHCGTLTYRQKPQAKRQPSLGIAAAQQIKVRTGARWYGGIRNEPIGGPLGICSGERRVAALYQDVLGFDAAIGLIRLVRSASSRG